MSDPLNLSPCPLCGRTCCSACRKLLFAGGELVEFAINVCNECRKHEQLVEKIQAILDGANKQLNEWVGLWKKAVKSGVKAP